MAEPEDTPPERRASTGWQDFMALVAAGRQAMERGAQVLGAGVAVVNDWFERHQAEITALNRVAQQRGEWFAAHREELAGFATWGTVATACAKADLYAPMSPAWLHFAENADDKDVAALEDLILAAYSPGGLGYDALRNELTTAGVLADRREEVEQVLTSLEDGRHYVAICGALPLAEGVLAATHGRWQSRLDAYPLTDRLDKDEGLTEEQVVDLILNHSALEMASNAANGIWKQGPHRAGTFTTTLNRHVALHGTGYGWHTQGNAVRSILLLAAMARVAGPLLGPLPGPEADDADGERPSG